MPIFLVCICCFESFRDITNCFSS